MLMQSLNDGGGIHGKPTVCYVPSKPVKLLNEANRPS